LRSCRADAEPFHLTGLMKMKDRIALDIIRGEILYTNDPDRQARYELFVLRRAADLLPFKKQRTRMILEEGAR